MNQLPSECSGEASERATNAFEHRVCRALLWSSPILFMAGWIVACLFAKNLLFRLPIEPINHLANFKMGLLGGMAAVSPAILWWLGLKLHKQSSFLRSPLLAASATLGMIGLVCWAMTFSQAKYALQESIKARAPQLNFVRNIVFQQQSLARPATQKPIAKIGLVGSSQVMLGIDADQLSKWTGGETHSCCMPGMVPMQYAAIANAMADKKLTHVICWLSEFDFFREQALPTIRLRWCSNPTSISRLFTALDGELCLSNRGELADLGLAAWCPLWQQRSLFQMGAFRFWWRFDNVATSNTTVDLDEQKVGGKLVAKEQGVANAKKNIQRTPLLAANMTSFDQFAELIVESGAKLIVIEGESHPDTMKAYPTEFRLETRDMLIQRSKQIGFTYVPQDDRPAFPREDWRDAVHLNQRGRMKLTRFVSDLIGNDGN